MPRLLAALVALLLVLAACSSDAESPGAAGSTTTADASADPDCDPETEAALTAWEGAGFSGTVAITTGGEPDCLGAYGEADAEAGTPTTVDTVFSIGSITKAVTAASIFRLVDDGKLTLDDRAGDLVGGLDGPAAEATVAQLLLHTSGLTGSHGSDHEPLTRDQAIAAISGLERAFPAGTDSLYSNAGYTLLALIAEEVAGTPYRELTAEVLALPGGGVAGGFWDGEPAAPGPRAGGALDDGTPGETGDFAGPHWALDGNGSLAMTMPQLAAWTHALFTGEIVSAASTAAIAAPGFDLGDGSAETPGWVALDDETFGEPLLTAAGGGGDVGQHAVVVWLPESERVIAAASSSPDLPAGDLLEAIGPALVAGDPLPRPDEGDAPAEVDPDALAAAEGTYALDPGGTLTVEAGDDGLAVTPVGADAVAALFPLPPDGGFTPDDVTAHEALVTALLAGETPAGREERAAFEASVGPIDAVTLAGTIVADGELRSYATITSEADEVLVWFALDEEGGVAGAEVPTDPPTLDLVPTAEGAFRPDDPAGEGADLTATFAADGLTITGPDGTTVARPA